MELVRAFMAVIISQPRLAAMTIIIIFLPHPTSGRQDIFTHDLALVFIAS
jgi:hypothetical protein